MKSWLAVGMVFMGWGCTTSQPLSLVQMKQIKVYFSPQGGCTQAILDQIGGSTKSVLVQAYSFTSDSIRDALVAVKQRGVRVEVLLDKGLLYSSAVDANVLVAGGVLVLVDGKERDAHNKVMVIDGQTVVTGSFNFTTTAEKYSAENVLVIYSPTLAESYTENWKKHRDHSVLYLP